MQIRSRSLKFWKDFSKSPFISLAIPVLRRIRVVSKWCSPYAFKHFASESTRSCSYKRRKKRKKCHSVSTRNVSTRNVSTRNVSTRNVSTRNVSTRNVSTRNVSTRNISTRDVSTRNVSTRDVSTRNVSTRDVSTRDVSTRNVSTRNVSTRDVSTRNCRISPGFLNRVYLKNIIKCFLNNYNFSYMNE